MQSILEYLLTEKDESYRSFMLPLLPGVSPERIIGVRTPTLRLLAKRIAGTAQAEEFMRSLPHHYFEENNLHGFLLEHITSFDRALELTDAFLAHIDNWATCDQTNPKALIKEPQLLLRRVDIWLSSEHTYTIRFAIETLMRYFLSERFDEHIHDRVVRIQSDEYYVRMMQAWYLATALALQYEATIPLLENEILPEWVHNKTIRKAIESRRITPEHKEYLRTLKK